jgi:hypothetical protein
MTDQERAFELFVGINPVPDVTLLRTDLAPAPAFLIALEQGNMAVETSQVRQLPRVELAPIQVTRRRLGIAIAVGVFVFAALIGLGVWLAFADRSAPDVIEGPIPTTGPYGLPDFSSDPVSVGAALTAAQNTHDPDVFLSLLADDAELRFGIQVVSPDDIRAGVTLTGAGGRYQYDRAWARIVNEEEVYSSCEANGKGVICDLESTSDHLKPVLPPIPDIVGIQVLDGQITLFQVAGVADPSNDILSDFQAWTFENYPEEAALMWTMRNFPEEVRSEESALLHLQLGEEYLAQR